MNELPDMVNARIQSAYKAALIRACIELRDLIREKISIPGTRHDRSQDDDPPRLQSGNLWRSFKWVVASTATTIEDAQVFSDPAIAPYWIFVEEGTKNMAARPHYWTALEEYDFPAHVQLYFEEELNSPTRTFSDVAESTD